MILTLGLSGCKKEATARYNFSEKDWDTILEEARGTTVTFYGYDGDQKTTTG